MAWSSICAEYDSTVPVAADVVTGILIQLTVPASVSKLKAPNSALSRTVRPARFRPLKNVEVALPTPATNKLPAIESVAPGDVVPIPTRPKESSMNAVEVADAVEVEMRNIGPVPFDTPPIDKRAAGDEVPTAKRLLVLSQRYERSPETPDELVQNVA